MNKIDINPKTKRHKLSRLSFSKFFATHADNLVHEKVF